MENFTLPDKIKDIRAPIVELIKKNAELVMTAENWAFKNKGKNEEEMIKKNRKSMKYLLIKYISLMRIELALFRMQ